MEEAEALGDVRAAAAVGITCVADVDGAAEADVDDSGPYGAETGEEDCSRSNRQEEPVVEPDLPPRRSMRACLRRARLKLVRGNGRTPIDWDFGAMSMDLWSYGKIVCLSFEQWRCISILQGAGNVGRRGVCLKRGDPP